MLRNPIHKRLEHLSPWQHLTFMATLCERMYPNFHFFCQDTEFTDPVNYRKILDLVWESLVIKDAKINFDTQLEKLESIIPSINDFDIYAVYPAIDACEALSELLHAHLSGSTLEHAIAVSQISMKTIAELEMAREERELNDTELKNCNQIIDELDIQWEIYRLLREQEERNIELIKGLKSDIRESGSSNIGLFLS